MSLKGKNEIDTKVMTFLESLTFDQANFTNHLKEFEDFFFNIKCQPVFTQDNIKRLFKVIPCQIMA